MISRSTSREISRISRLLKAQWALIASRTRTCGKRKDFAVALLSAPRDRRALAAAFAQVYRSSVRISPNWKEVAGALAMAAKAPQMAKQIASADARQHVLRWLNLCDVRTSPDLNQARRVAYDLRTATATSRTFRRNCL